MTDALEPGASAAFRKAVILKPSEAALAAFPFLSGMRAEHLRILADSAMEVEFAPGQLVFREGEIANRFYLIRQGKVALEAPAMESGAVPIQTLSDGDVLGWSW